VIATGEFENRRQKKLIELPMNFAIPVRDSPALIMF